MIFCKIGGDCMVLLIYILLICISFLPKLNVINIGGSTTGIRIEDFLILLILIFLIFYFIKNNKKIQNKEINKIQYAFFIYFTFAMLSTGLGIIYGFVSTIKGILFLIRKLEYFSLVYIGIYFSKVKKINIEKSFDLIVIFHFLICILQILGVIGSFNKGEFQSTMTQGRVSSTFNGAYELSAFLLLLLPYYLNNMFFKNEKKFKNFIFSFLITICIFLSESRTSIVLEIFIIAFMLLKTKYFFKYKKRIIISAFILVITCYFLASFVDLSRFFNLSVEKTIFLIKYTWENKNFTLYNSTGYWYGNASLSISEMYNLGYDASSYARFSHWMQLIDGWIKYPIFGLGVSVSGGAADGNYIKILCETGIVGLVLWCLVLFNIIKFLKSKNSFLYYSFISIIIGSLFIDLFDASKLMMLFWFSLGCLLNYERTNKRSLCYENTNY